MYIFVWEIITLRLTPIKCMPMPLFQFPNHLPGLQQTQLIFKKFRSVEKPPKFVLKGDLEALMFTINTKLFSRARPVYHPPEGRLISDIKSGWDMLDKVEHVRELELREAMLRLEKVMSPCKRTPHTICSVCLHAPW